MSEQSEQPAWWRIEIVADELSVALSWTRRAGAADQRPQPLYAYWAGLHLERARTHAAELADPALRRALVLIDAAEKAVLLRLGGSDALRAAGILGERKGR